MKDQHRFTKPPVTLSSAKLDNLALVPGNLLPFKSQYQTLANQLPQGSVLIVSSKHPQQQQMLITLARNLTKQGKRVRLITRLTYP